MRKKVKAILFIFIFLVSALIARSQDWVDENVFELDKMITSVDGFRIIPEDTLSIEDIILIKKTPPKWFNRYEKRFGAMEFIISKTPSTVSGLNYGLYWPSGAMVKLPRNYVAETPRLKNGDNGMFILWYERLGDGVYSGYGHFLPLLNLPEKRIKIIPIYY